jgi:hypothetical protein
LELLGLTPNALCKLLLLTDKVLELIAKGGGLTCQGFAVTVHCIQVHRQYSCFAL